MPTDGQPTFYVRRDGRIGRLSAGELLRAYQAGKIRAQDEIRQSGTTQWYRSEKFDWTQQQSLVDQTSNSSEPAVISEEAKLSREPQVSSSKSRRADQQLGQDGPSPTAESWWAEQSTTRGTNKRLRNNSWRLAALGCAGLGIAAVIVYWSLFSEALPTPKVATSLLSNTEQPELIAGANDAPPLPPIATPESSTESEFEPEREQIITDSLDNVAEDERTGDIVIEATSESEIPNLESSLPPTDAVVPAAQTQATAEVRAESIETLMQPNPAPLADAITPAQPTDLVSKPLEEQAFAEASAELAGKSEVDLQFDKTAAVLNFHLSVSQSLAAATSKWSELSQSISELQSYVNEGTVLAQSIPQEIAGLNALVAQYTFDINSGPTGREHLFGKRNEAIQRVRMLNAKFAELRNGLPLRNKELFTKSQNLGAIEAELTRLIGQEAESTTSLMAGIDFFGESPVEYQRRVQTLTETLLASNPDFLLGYLLYQYASLHVGDLGVIDQKSQDFERQLRMLPSRIAELRGQILTRYRAINLCALAVARTKDGQLKEAVKQLNVTKDIDANFVEGWLLRGCNSVQLERMDDARQEFQRAIRMQPQDPRVYRVAIRAVSGSSQVPQSVLKTWISEITQLASHSDWQSWLVASQATLQLGELQLAREYFRYVKRSPLNAQQVDELAEKLGVFAQPTSSGSTP
jgi:tetratricopeptide (TPR) repeat protein